ncbi:MAG: hypothetical protein BalsKO_32430 [Balneolaceae bacterium]
MEMILNETDRKICAFCKKKEGDLTLTLLHKVQIETINVFGTKKPLCTKCKDKFNQALEERYELGKQIYSDRGLFYLRKLLQGVYF